MSPPLPRPPHSADFPKTPQVLSFPWPIHGIRTRKLSARPAQRPRLAPRDGHVNAVAAGGGARRRHAVPAGNCSPCPAFASRRPRPWNYAPVVLRGARRRRGKAGRGAPGRLLRLGEALRSRPDPSGKRAAPRSRVLQAQASPEGKWGRTWGVSAVKGAGRSWGENGGPAATSGASGAGRWAPWGGGANARALGAGLGGVSGARAPGPSAFLRVRAPMARAGDPVRSSCFRWPFPRSSPPAPCPRTAHPQVSGAFASFLPSSGLPLREDSPSPLYIPRIDHRSSSLPRVRVFRVFPSQAPSYLPHPTPRAEVPRCLAEKASL